MSVEQRASFPVPERSSSRRRLLLPLLFLAALLLRLFGLSWDGGHHFHPDERAIADAVMRLSFHPLHLNPHFFAYGSFPLYVIRVVTSLPGTVRPWFAGYDSVILTGRALSALWGAATVVLLALLGRRLYGERVGLLAGALLAGSVLHLQNSHFATSDIPLTFLVLLALFALLRFLETGSLRWAAGAGLVAGLAIATKFSALPLLVPAGVALAARAEREPRRRRLAGAGLLLLVFVAAGAALGEPFAFLDFRAFAHDIVEQGEMVRHAGSRPFTNQFVGLPNYLYELRELTLWGMGPLLGAACLWGTARRLRSAVKTKNGAELVLLSWVVVLFAITGSFQAKFPRYLLPLYPLVILWAAASLEEWGSSSRAGRVARGVVLAGTAAYLLAFLSIYTRPHVTVTASEWFYGRVPAGSNVLTPDWDEGFPVPLPDRAPDRYRLTAFAFQEPDDPGKTSRLAAGMASADFLALQSKRAYGGYTRAPETFPATTRFFARLFAGELGYTLEADFVSRPGLLGLELPDELADESFSVYDHPKAVIFRNTGHLSAAEIERRIATPPPHRVSRRDMLLARAGGAAAEGLRPDSGLRSSLPAALLFALLLEGLGLAGYAVLARAVGVRPGAYALGKVLGVLLFSYLVWITSSIGWLPFRPSVCRAAALLVMIGGLVLWRRTERASIDPREWRATELVFWGAFALFLGVRAVRPEIYWGEKPMDFAFLNALYRTETLPPPEPWFAGAPLRYTYFGHFTVAALGKALAIHPALMFNMGLAATAALTAAGLFAAGSALRRRWQAGGLAVLLGLVAGNLSGVFELHARRAIDFDTFWATSRVVPSTVNEFPFWSFLFADLHAHLLVMPATVGFVSLLLLAVPTGSGPALALLALVLGAIGVTSGWSLPVHLVVLGALLLAGARSGIVRKAVLPALAVAVGALAAYAPFWLKSPPRPVSWGWERGPHTTLWQYVTIFGLFLTILVPFLCASGRRTLVRRRVPPRDRFPLVLALLGLAITAACEVVFVWDRMNTLFKYYLEAWLLLALASSGVLFDLLRGRFGRRAPVRIWRGAVGVTMALALLTSATDIAGFLRMNRVDGPSLTLDGMAYLGRHAPFDGAAFDWIDRNVPGLPVLCEAQGPPYQEFSRVSMNTGLPSLLGWEYHVFQRGRSTAEIERRKRDVATIYTSADEAAVAEVLHRDHVALVYVGPLERETYGGANLANLGKWNDLLSPLYQNPGVTLFAVRGASFDASAPFVEMVSAETREEAATAQDPPGRLREPRSLTVDGAGNVFVADFGNDRIQKLDPSLHPLAAWGRRGKTAGEFNQPCGVALGPSGALYVSDTWNGRVQVFDPSGAFLREWRFEFFGARGIAVDEKERVFVADTGNHRIVRFSSDGKKELEWGGRGEAPGQLFEPMGLAAGAGGRILVCDAGNGRLQEFDADGRILRTFRVPGWRRETYSEPTVALDPDGTIWVTVPLAKEVRAYGPDGVPKEVLKGAAASPPFETPMGVAFDTVAGRLLVCDVEGHLSSVSRTSR